jgi:hypothetical protein
VDHPTAGAVRRQHPSAVLRNRLRLERRWGRPCLACNVCLRPGPEAAAALSAVQDRLLSLEPSLPRVPAPALHTNLAWLLPVHEEFSRPKDELWQQHGPGWLAVLAAATGEVAASGFSYGGPLRDPARLVRWLAATEFQVHVGVSELLVVRELTFPSLDHRILHRLALAPSGPEDFSPG